MSDFMDDFAEEMNNTYSVYPKYSDLNDNDELIEGFEESALFSGEPCNFQLTGQSESLLSDRYKIPISGIIFSRVRTVPKRSKIVLGTGEEFFCIFGEDVGMQGDAMQIFLTNQDYGESI